MTARATHLGHEWLGRYEQTRRASVELCTTLSPEDCTVQSMPDVSPTKWHLAHTTWFFETFVLEPLGVKPQETPDEYRILFNSYYNEVGEQFARERRGLVTRPGLDEVLAYRRRVDRVMAEVLAGELSSRLADIVDVGLHHEQQHQELMLMDIKHVFAQNPLYPAYIDEPALGGKKATIQPEQWVSFEAGIHEIGASDHPFAFDNERPRHRALVNDFSLQSRPVTNGEYLEFIEAGGYSHHRHWLSDGWATIQKEGLNAPLYWIERGGQWFEFTLKGLRELELGAPVCHVSYYEADAYAHFRDRRLPTEFEWEVAATTSRLAVDGNFVESHTLQPLAPAPRMHAAASSATLQQMFGDVWEWTQSAYGGYPGFRAPPGALGEYNGKFMSNQMVLRGGSCLSSRSHLRATYRNFFYPHQRWQCSGIRLARDDDGHAS